MLVVLLNTTSQVAIYYVPVNMVSELTDDKMPNLDMYMEDITERTIRRAVWPQLRLQMRHHVHE